MGCRVCEIACSYRHFGEYNPLLARLRVPRAYPLPQAPKVCLQCVRPKCVDACSAGALIREERMVAYYHDKCIQCGACIKACPFERTWRGPNGMPLKCDLCGGNPECVSLCPKHALSFIET